MTPYETPDYAAFVAAIRATPDDDLPRLVAADWLEEQGEIERAEFIRVQVRIAELDHELMISDDCEHPACPGCAERRGLKVRERHLSAEFDPRRFVDWTGINAASWVASGTVWRRGFVDRLRTMSDLWFAYADDILRLNPVREVVISGPPAQMPDYWQRVWPGVTFTFEPEPPAWADRGESFDDVLVRMAGEEQTRHELGLAAPGQ